jgi:methylthioribose-1-phosphate isomerase
MTSTPAVDLETVGWVGDCRTGGVRLIDQTRLPSEFTRIVCRDVPTLWEAIRTLRVRGAPAIGIAAAYGVVLGARRGLQGPEGDVLQAVRQTAGYLRASRPTAVNLFWAVERMERVAAESSSGGEALVQRLLDEAEAIRAEDQRMCRAIGRHGSDLITSGQGILTHCNAGGLATADYGTALAVIFAAHERGKLVHVYADETRPLLQGARLTTWELAQRGIPVTLLCDNMAAQVMKEGRVQLVVVGADRIASNGDTANKIGTYGLALLARAHHIPFYVAAPSSTFDLAIPDGSHIPIEQRDPREVTHPWGHATAPEGISVYNPAFDVTPASLIQGIVTEHGIIHPVDRDAIRHVLTGDDRTQGAIQGGKVRLSQSI